MHDEAIYLVGGVRGLNDKFTDNIERFRDQTWEKVDLLMDLRVKCASIWSRGNGKFVIFGGQLEGGSRNTDVYHLNLEKLKCSKKPVLKTYLENCNSDQYCGSDEDNCFTFMHQNMLVKYDSAELNLTRFNLITS